MTGEFDLASVPMLRKGFTTASPPDRVEPRVLLDLTGVTFIDSTILDTIAAFHTVVSRRQGQVVWAGAHGLVRRVLRITELDRVIKHYDTVELAARNGADRRTNGFASGSAPPVL